ncbi:MAG: hypothetical protein WC382_11320 [Methanoregulaceae archaeon]|jgi:hypothetical protein
MEKILYTYALIKTLSDNNSEYIDSFWPLIVRVLPAKKELALFQVQKTIRDEIQIEIPNHALEFILHRAKKRGYINHSIRDRYSLTKKGDDYKKDLLTERQIQRDINALIKDIKNFFQTHFIDIECKEISNFLEHILKKNFEPLMQFFHTKQTDKEWNLETEDSRENLLIEYIIEAEKSKPTFFKTIEEMFYGSLISTLLYSNEPEKVFEINKTGFTNCDVYLDTNFVFSLLDLHRTDEGNQSAKELFRLLKDFYFNIKVFSFTVDEIVRVLNSCAEGASYQHPDEGNIYSTLKKKGWTKSDIIIYSSHIEQTLADKGIVIETIPDFDYKTYEPKNANLKPMLESYKNWWTQSTITHDLAAIEKIQEKRGKRIRDINEVNAIFLTSDARLKNFNLYKMGHSENKTICEVFLDRLLTTMLWLINPKVNLSLTTIISAHSKGLFAKWHVFDQFFKTANAMKIGGKINEEQINALFYNNFITEELSRLDDRSLTSITPEFVFDRIEKAKMSKQKSIEEQTIISEEKEKYCIEIKTIQENLKNSTHLMFMLLKWILFIGPILYTLYNYVSTGDISWLLIISFGVAILTLSSHIFGSISLKIDKIETNIADWRFQRLKSNT